MLTPLYGEAPTGRGQLIFQTKKPVSFDDWVATDKDIGKAVKLWCKDPEDALARYGKPIGEWDVSRVTDMGNLFDIWSTLLLVGSMLLIAGFIVGRKATRAAESQPLLATTA